MKKNILALTIASIAVNANAGTVTSDGDDVVVKTKGGFSVKTADKKNAFNIGGRIQWDYDNTEVDGALDSTTNDLGVRRARIYLKGTVDKDWDYKAQFNIGTDGTEAGTVEDLYIRYKGWGKMANLTVGRQKEPFGLEEQISSKDISVLERSAMTEQYAFGRNVGVQLHGKSGKFTYGIGLFEDESGSKGAEDIALTARATYAAVNDSGNVLHFGVGLSERADDKSAYNLEVAGVNGVFHFQSEFFNSKSGSISNDGYYLQAGWILTGESRPYKDGKFKIVKPSSDAGAWEAVIRYEDGFGKFSDTKTEVPYGDDKTSKFEGNQLALGLNYYPNSAIRVGTSYMMAQSDHFDVRGNEFRIRLQYVYK